MTNWLLKFRIADRALHIWDEMVPGRILSLFGFAILSALILATRYANYQDVFIAGNVYFVDADCYAADDARGMVSAKPGLIVRHHTFENFPQGTTPHTTAPLDYLILELSLLLKRFTAQPLDMAGAFVSPLLALFEGWFLVVGTKNEIPVSLGDARSLCDQPHSRSRDGTWQARSSILVDAARHSRDVRSGVRRARAADSVFRGVDSWSM